jgi:hypothetical protein
MTGMKLTMDETSALLFNFMDTIETTGEMDYNNKEIN